MTTIVLVHGRRQQGKDPRELEERWLRALDAGLATSGAPGTRSPDVVLPFYGDVLHAAELAAESSGVDIDLESVREGRGRAVPTLPDGVARVQSDLLRDVAAAHGIEDVPPSPSSPSSSEDGIDRESLWGEGILRLPVVVRLLDAISDRTGIGQEVIESFLTDVAVYLTVARQEVLDVVRPAVRGTSGPIVIVAHSLGGAVAADLLQDDDIRQRTTAWMTVGSPLGVRAVTRNLLGCPPGADRPPHPDVAAWAAVWDPEDIVALGHPLAPDWGPPLDDLSVDNPPGRAHDIEEYLRHGEVARWLAEHGATA